MIAPPSLADASKSVREAIGRASQGLIEREALIELVALAAVAGEHLLVVGPPGTAKSEAVRRIARALGGTYFEYLLGRFTEPSEIFGPIDLRRLREGVVETETAGMLPEAEIAFLDEVFLGSTAILNTLLGVLNERVFRRGHTVRACPLRVCVGASNGLPEDPALAAFADRFLMRIFVGPVPDPMLETLLEGGWSVGAAPLPMGASLEAIDGLRTAARASDMGPIRPHLAEALRTLRSAGIGLTDRTAVKTQRLVAAAAVLAGRAEPTQADLWPILFAVPTAEGQRIAREAMGPVLARSQNDALASAAAEASLGPLARADLLVREGETLLAAAPPPDPDAARAHRLCLEGLMREIDAGFAANSRPAALSGVRQRLADRLR